MPAARGRPALKIAYVCYWNLLSKDGVAEKIDAQVARWESAGHTVDVFCLSRGPARQDPARRDWIRFPFATLSERVRATKSLVETVRGAAPDFVYLRYDLFVPPPVSLLRRHSSAVEVNSDDRREVRLRRERAGLSTLYNELNRRALLSSVDGIVCVTNELAESPLFTSFGKPTVVIANGVDLDRIAPVPPARNARPRIVFLGSRRQAWHGMDKIVWLAGALPDADFEIVGYEPEDMPPGLPLNVRVHGILARADYEPLLGSSDLAIGTLALHRKQMTEACPLKVREYLAYGLPVVVAYEDTDFIGEDDWFMLRLPNTETNVRDSVAEIRSFLDGIRGKRVPRDAVEDRIGSHAKEKLRLEFFHQLATDQPAASASS